MDNTELLDLGFSWTADRISVAQKGNDLGRPTDCGEWDLRALVDHTVASVGMLIDSVATMPASPAATWDDAIADLAVRSHAAWQVPGVMERTLELPVGTFRGSALVSAALLELVVHGWDISQASGEAAAIPDELATPILAFAREAIQDESRGDAFGPAVEGGPSPAEQLLAHLGRTPR
jgi:uncharacterized protein (TIGR03086 family)